MSVISDLREAWDARRKLTVAMRRAEAQVAQVAETMASRAAADLADEDASWRKLGEGEGEYSAANLRDIRKRCRRLYELDPTVAQAVSLLRSGALRDGELEPSCADKRVQETVDAFWTNEDNELALTSRDGLSLLHLSLMLEGERFLTLFTTPQDAAVVVGDVSADEITDVIMHPENRRRPVLYKRQYTPSVYDPKTGRYEHGSERVTEYLRDWRLAPEVAGERHEGDTALQDLLASVQGINEDCYCYHARIMGLGARGVPAVWRAYEWAKAHGQSLSSMMTLTAALAMFAWQAKVKTNSAATLKTFAQALEDSSRAQGPGAAWTSNEAVDLAPINVGTGGQQIHESTARQMHLQEIRAFGFGEHWYADSTRGNLATATAMELPAVWRIEDHQALVRQTLTQICGFAVAVAQDRGKLPGDVDVTVSLNMPDAQPASPVESAQLLQALTLAAQAGLIDVREASLQAYQALGTVGVEAIMERQYPAEYKDEGDAPTSAGGVATQPTPGLEPQPQAAEESTRAQEAVADRPFGSGLRLPE